MISIRTQAERKRLFELIAVLVTTLLLVLIARLETRLFDLSESLARDHDFITTVIYFGIINLNVVLILVLGFLVFRNVAKLLIDRRRGVLGSRLRTKLVAVLVFFALAPTILMFYISTGFITRSFDEWFSERVRTTIQQTREAGAMVYKQDQRRMESLARIGLNRVTVIPEATGANSRDLRSGLPTVSEPQLPARIDARRLDGFESEYGLSVVRVYDRNGSPVWASQRLTSEERAASPDQFVMSAIERFDRDSGLVSISTVAGEEKQDVVKGIAPITDPASGRLIGVILAEERFETRILRSIETILAGFANLRPGAQLIRLSYMILMGVVAMLIIFAAIWLGFYVARAITGPIQSLAEATREVALGNYSVSLSARTDDEAGQLVHSFNQMTRDLRQHKMQADDSRSRLEMMNVELEQRRQYMEVILKNITAGVIAVDPGGLVTAVNHAAERLLGVRGLDAIGRDVRTGMGDQLYNELWKPFAGKLSDGRSTFSGQIDFESGGRRLTLLADAARIFDERGVDQGTVLVFDDATEQVKAQRVAAWREVARRIAHEIKNPITPIKLSAQRLLRRFRDDFQGEDREVFESCIETILVQVDSLRDLVNEFSKFSRLPSIQTKTADVNVVIRDVIGLYRMSYPEIVFDDSGLGPIPAIPIDREQMNRAFVNLVTNSIAAFEGSAKPWRIEFRSLVLVDANAIRIEISDSGCGIPAKLKDRVLEPYFSTKQGGTGLGLAIVNQIVSDHGGYLRLTDREPRGTTVVIELPMGASSPAGSTDVS